MQQKRKAVWIPLERAGIKLFNRNRDTTRSLGAPQVDAFASAADGELVSDGAPTQGLDLVLLHQRYCNSQFGHVPHIDQAPDVS